jgi:hypothetical protein
MRPRRAAGLCRIRKFSTREVVNILRVHGIGSYKTGSSVCPVDSNFCKNQARRPVAYHRLALTVDVFTVRQLFTVLDGSFAPGILETVRGFTVYRRHHAA